MLEGNYASVRKRKRITMKQLKITHNSNSNNNTCTNWQYIWFELFVCQAGGQASCGSGMMVGGVGDMENIS